ncbi:MAG: hypothetical protein Kow0042_30720 [Calditrichia bacterium]
MNDKNFFVEIGNTAISFFTSVYEITVLFLNTLKAFPHLLFYRRQLAEQLYNFSISTLPIAAVISIFVGFGSTVQGVYQTTDIVPRHFTVNVIFKSTIIELSPIILPLVLAGKIGASVAAEIGSMRITEQIDALEITPLDPVGFLVLPRGGEIGYQRGGAFGYLLPLQSIGSVPFFRPDYGINKIRI